MQFEGLLAGLGLGQEAETVRSLRDRLPVDAPPDWRNLAAALAVQRAKRSMGTSVLGIGGGQGAGKTTLADLLVQAVAFSGCRAEKLSLDDFYLPRAVRGRLARNVHPLLATRGVPGTHDVTLAMEVIDAVVSGSPVRCPVFDKATDDRLPDARWRSIEAGVNLVIFEGWCLGAPAQPAAALAKAVNDLERQEDPDGVWRRHVNDCLAGDYQTLWQRVDELLFLAVPDLAAVIRWRTEQEQQHPPERRMTPSAIRRFVAHYERLTRWMLTVLPARADMVGLLDNNHALTGIRGGRS